MSDDERAILTFEQALALLPAGDWIHTFRSTGPIVIGADWQREDILSLIRKYGAELAGDSATSMSHGLAVIDSVGPLFIETKSRRQ